MSDPQAEIEDLEAFRLRARAWLAENMPRLADELSQSENEWENARELQRKLFDGGFAGICFPAEYGGQGLTHAYQRVLDEETVDYEMPLLLNIPSLAIIAPTILEFGSEAQKKRYLPAAIRGDEVWVQFLSEPTSGSDLASVMTRATRDGDSFILNGSKVWSSGAHAADYAICVTRTNWDVTKHDGITVLLVKIHQPGIKVDRILNVSGGDEFCQEFFDDVRIPAEDVLGEVDGGWTVVKGLLAHERGSMGGASIYVSGQDPFPRRRNQLTMVDLVHASGLQRDPQARQFVAEAHVLGIVQELTARRVTSGIASGHFPLTAGALLRLMGARAGVRRSDIALELAGITATAWQPEDIAGQVGVQFIGRQGGELGGGSTEIQRNIISERVLGMPREFAADMGMPFNEVRRNAMPTRRGS